MNWRKLSNTAVNTAATIPSLPLCVHKRKFERDKCWWCYSVYLYMKYCFSFLQTNKDTVFLLPSLFSLASSPSGMFCMSILQKCVSFRLSLVIFLPLTLFLCLLHHHKQMISFWEMASWWREAVTAEFQGVFYTNHNKYTMLDVPVIHISPHVSLLWHLSLLGLSLFSISPFSQQDNITKFPPPPNQGDFQQRLGLWVRLLEANAWCLRYCAYKLEREEGAKATGYCEYCD